MDTNQTYQVHLSILLRPIWVNNPPTIRIGMNGTMADVTLDKETWFDYRYTSASTVDKLQIEFYGKTDADTDIINNKDTAVIIEQVKLNGMASPKFAWAGVYTPNYPAHYIKDNPTSASTLSPFTYLGWNGVWELEFTVPVFTWIHKVEDLGWIHD
jgi:hypothetical protein